MFEDILVSVIMPAYNGEKYISKAIDSILQQTHTNFELLLVEDHSTDSTPAIIDTYKDERIRRFYNSKNMGISYSTNLASQNARGRYIALLDDDDMATPRRLELQVKYLEEHPEVDVLGGRSIDIDENDNFLCYEKEPIRNPKLIKANLLFYNKKFANCTVMYRRDFVLRNNIYYHENCLGMQDVKFYMDCAQVGTIATIDEVLHYKRIHSDEETVRQRKNNQEKRDDVFAKMQRESIENRGFKLEPEDYEVLRDCVKENVAPCYTFEQIEKLYRVFRKMIQQGEAQNIDYLPELKLACKKILGERMIVRSNIFDN